MTLFARGLDIAPDNQPLARMNYPAWAAASFTFGWVEYVRDGRILPGAAAHRAAMQTAGILCAGYINLARGSAAAQMAQYLAIAPPGEIPDMLDVEESTLTEADIRAACDAHDASGRQLVIYTGYWTWLAIVPQSARAYYKKYQVVIGSYPNDSPGPVQPTDAASVARRSNPPAVFAPPVPEPWTVADVFSHQYTGHGSLPGYASFLDLHIAPMTAAEMRAKYGAKTMSVPIAIQGCLIGGGAESGSDIIPIYTDLAAAGAVPPIIIGVHNPGLCVDAKRLGVQTTIARFMHPETGDDHDFEAGGSGRTDWSQEKRLRFARASIAMAFDHMNPTEAAATDFVQCSGNEWDAQDVGEWLATCDVWALVLDERDNRNAEYIRKNGKPLKLAMGIFNAGTPKTWPMYQAVFSHPVFGQMHDAGDFIGFHEGVGFGQPKDYLYNVPLDGAPVIEGSGLVNFRSDYALAALDSHGWAMPYGFLEWYDGFTRDADVAARIEALVWVDSHMGTGGPATRRHFRGYCAFELTNDPGSSWYRQDFTPVFKDPRWKAYAVSQIGRINGVTTMPITNAQKQAMQAKAAALVADINAIVVDDPQKHTMAGRSNQWVIDLFHSTFGGYAELDALGGVAKLVNLGRQVAYAGPALEDTTLTKAQKDALIAAGA